MEIRVSSSLRAVSLAALAGLLAACGSQADDEPSAGTEDTSAATDDAQTDTGDTEPDGTDTAVGETSAAAVTYWGDVKPIVDTMCGDCHNEAGVAPFGLQTYEDVATYMDLSMVAIHEGTMPPWQPSDGCNDYAGDFSLSAEQIEVLERWFEDDVPEGDPADEGAPLELEMPSLSRVDLRLEMPEAYVPRQSPDDYRCFLVPWDAGGDATSYVTGFRAEPGNDRIVHHVIAFLAAPDEVETYREMDDAEDGPGYTCFGGTGGPARTWLGAWAPGSRGSDLPEGIGLPVEPGSMIILQVHYNALSTDVEGDRTAVEFKIDDSVEREARIQPWANPGWLLGGSMQIPAGEADVQHDFSQDPTLVFGGEAPVTIFSAALHMHLLGRSGGLRVNRADGTSQCLLQIDDYDFNWQSSYGLTAPVEVQPGDQLELECHHDNSAENQPFIDGQKAEPQDVGWGEGTTDEMCLGVVLVAQ